MSKEDLPLINLAIREHERMILGYIKGLPRKVHRFEITQVRDQRSLSQLAYLFAVVYPCLIPLLKEQTGEAFDLLKTHYWFKQRYLLRATVNRYTGEVNGSYVPRMEELDKDECSQYIEQVIQFGMDGRIVVPPAAHYETSPA